MKTSLQQIIASIFAGLISVVVFLFLINNQGLIGEKPLLYRALLIDSSVFFALVALFPTIKFFAKKPTKVFLLVCLPALLPAFLFYFVIFPARTGGGFELTRVDSAFISDRSSNGIIEIGFQYPIYTPKISLKSHERFSKNVSLFLRITQNNGEKSLFRGVRSVIPGASLSVESSVQRMLSENPDYLLNPVQLAPGQEISGRVVFIISNQQEGVTFEEIINGVNSPVLEIRDSGNGVLLLESALANI
ncbi:MAG: hypothetical protein P8K27_02505 [Gammaproteobacteria bacterium]|nr:hypothetical protein [Gammaproteobacteria bacterium]